MPNGFFLRWSWRSPIPANERGSNCAIVIGQVRLWASTEAKPLTNFPRDYTRALKQESLQSYRR